LYLQTPGDLRRRTGASEQVVDANHHHVALRVPAEGAVREVQAHEEVLEPVPSHREEGCARGECPSLPRPQFPLPWSQEVAQTREVAVSEQHCLLEADDYRATDRSRRALGLMTEWRYQPDQTPLSLVMIGRRHPPAM